MRIWCDKCDGAGKTFELGVEPQNCKYCSGKGYTHASLDFEEIKAKAKCLDIIYKLIDEKQAKLEVTDVGAIELKPSLKVVKDFKQRGEDYLCDDCLKPESEAGSLIHGRLKDGRDYQFCKKCRFKYGDTLTILSL